MTDLGPLKGKSLKAYKKSNARINCYEGSVRSGKTVTSLLRWVKFVRTAPPGYLLMVGTTQDTIYRNVINPLIDIFGKNFVQYNRGTREATICGRGIFVVGASDERAQGKIRGLTLAGAYCDEVSTYPESFFTMLLSRLSVEGAKLFGTTNPDSMMHWLYTEYLEKARLHLTGEGNLVEYDGEERLDLARFSFRLTDNSYLDKEYVKQVEKEFTGLWYRRFILGEWVLAEGAVYDMFDPATHVVDSLPPIQRFYAAGVDYGTTNPFHAVLLGLGQDDNLYVCSDYRYDSKKTRRQKTDSQYARELDGWLSSTGLRSSRGQAAKPEYLIIDPSAASFKTECYQYGFSNVTSADNKVLDGIRCVSSLLSNERLFIHRSCKDLVGEMTSYAWDTGAAIKGEDAPLKVNDHGVDALRYAVFTTRPLWRSKLALAA